MTRSCAPPIERLPAVFNPSFVWLGRFEGALRGDSMRAINCFRATAMIISSEHSLEQSKCIWSELACFIGDFLLNLCASWGFIVVALCVTLLHTFSSAVNGRVFCVTHCICHAYRLWDVIHYSLPFLTLLHNAHDFIDACCLSHALMRRKFFPKHS